MQCEELLNGDVKVCIPPIVPLAYAIAGKWIGALREHLICETTCN